MYQQYPPGQQGQQVPPQQYYAYQQYPTAYPQQPQHQQQQPQQPQSQPQPGMQLPQPVPQQYYQQNQQAPPPPPQVAQPSPPQQPVASVPRSYKTNPAPQETSEDELDCCSRTLRITLLLCVAAGFVFSSLAGASCDFMTFYREPPPPSPSLPVGQESQIDSSDGGGGAGIAATQSPSATPAAAAPASQFNNSNSSISIGGGGAAIARSQSPSATPAAAAPASLFNNSNSSISVGAAELQESFNVVNNNNTQATDITTEPASKPNPTLGPTPGPRGAETSMVVLQEVNSSPLESNEEVVNNIGFYILPDDENGRGRQLLLLNRALQENTTSFEAWLPEYLQELLANTTINAGIGINRWAPVDKTTCQKYDYAEFDSFFHTAQVGAVVACISSGLAFFLLAAEFTCCRFFCSRLLVVFCLISAMIGQCMTFFIYGTPNCTDTHTQSYNCDLSTGTIYSITATILHLIGAILGCPTPKSKPFLRVLVDKERKKGEVVDPCCWCFAGKCAKKPLKSDEEVAQSNINDPESGQVVTGCGGFAGMCAKKPRKSDEEVAQSNINDPESGQVVAAVGAPPPLVPVPIYYVPQPHHPVPNEIQVHGDANPPSVQTQSDSSNLRSTQRNVELFSIRQDAFIPGDSMSVPGMMPSGGGDYDSLGGGGRSVKSQRSAYTNPEFYESDLFFDSTPSVIDEEEGEDDVESGTGNYE